MLAQDGVSALEPLYDLTASRLVRYAFMLTRNQEDAEDALQAAMVRIALKPKSLARARHPWAYFLKVVRNEALKITRKRRSLRTVPTLNGVRQAEPQFLGEFELRQSVQKALHKLPPTQAEVVVLKVWEEMTFAEIGEVLGQSPNTAASRYRYALQKLARHLEPFCDEVSYV